MANFFVMLLFGAIGAIFGPVGFFIGIAIGIFAWMGSSKDKPKVAPRPVAQSIPVFTGNEHTPSPPRQTSPSSDQVREYGSIAVDVYAYILSFYPNSDSTKANEITEILRNDDWITDKVGALEELARRLPLVQVERRDSSMLFQLHSNALMERVLRQPGPMKSRLAMQLDGFVGGCTDVDPIDCKKLVKKFRDALRLDSPASSERLDAEDFIARSGDPKAISTLQEMRRNPSRYKELLRSGASGNTVLKTAFGVFAGMLAADAVKAAVTEYQLKNLHTQLDHEIAKAGGLDNVPLKDKELDSFSSDGTVEDINSSFSGGAVGDSWEDDATSRTSGMVGSDNSNLEDDTGFVADSENDTVSDVEIADSSSDFSFDYDD